MISLEEYLSNKKTTPAVLVGQTTGSSGANQNNATNSNTTTTAQTAAKNAFDQAKNAANTGKVTNPQIGYVQGGLSAVGIPVLTTKTSSGGSGGGSGGGTSSVVTDYQSTLNDLYNKVMGYGSYQAGTYTPTTFTPENYTPGSSYTPTAFTAGVYTPTTYSQTVDTSGAEAALQAAMADIQGYGDFSYDLNADMLYQQALDNYMMKGQQAAADTTAMAAVLTGGYGNSYAALVGNQAYQDHITQANNMIPQFQQMALDTWQSGYDRLLNDYNAISQQLANLLNIEGMNFNIWNANESNAANAFSMNEANRYNAWASNEQNAFNAWNANEQLKQDSYNINQNNAFNAWQQNENNAFNAWQQNEQNAYNEWLAGYTQAQDQYELAKDYYTTLEALQQSSGGGSSSSSKSSSTSSKTPTATQTATTGNQVVLPSGTVVNTTPAVTNPYTSDQYYELLEQLKKK